MLSVLMVSLGTASVGGALALAIPLWLGFVVLTMTINHRF